MAEAPELPVPIAASGKGGTRTTTGTAGGAGGGATVGHDTYPLTPGQAIKNVMHGTTVLGHPLHPPLTDLPLGAWTVGVVADWLFVATGRVPPVAGDLALAVGVAGAILAALTGFTDFHETDGHERRTAMVHGLVMSSVLVLEIVSLAIRLGLPSVRPSARWASRAGITSPSRNCRLPSAPYTASPSSTPNATPITSLAQRPASSRSHGT